MIDSTELSEYEESIISGETPAASFHEFWQRQRMRFIREDEEARERELRANIRKQSFKAKQRQAKQHTATIFKLLQQSRSCSSCECKLDNDGLFSVRPHLICDEKGQRLICGKCHREGDNGEPIMAFMHGTR